MRECMFQSPPKATGMLGVVFVFHRARDKQTVAKQHVLASFKVVLAPEEKLQSRKQNPLKQRRALLARQRFQETN